jgi:hypothetical protein
MSPTYPAMHRHCLIDVAFDTPAAVNVLAGQAVQLVPLVVYEPDPHPRHVVEPVEVV